MPEKKKASKRVTSKNKKKAGNGTRRAASGTRRKRRTTPDGDAIAVAAYYLAEKRGFAPGNEWQDWFEAERQIHADR